MCKIRSNKIFKKGKASLNIFGKQKNIEKLKNKIERIDIPSISWYKIKYITKRKKIEKNT